jgi:hypothetical protein
MMADIAEIKQAIGEAVKPIADSLNELKTNVKEMSGKVNETEVLTATQDVRIKQLEEKVEKAEKFQKWVYISLIGALGSIIFAGFAFFNK